jgi:hypothetical protein
MIVSTRRDTHSSLSMLRAWSRLFEEKLSCYRLCLCFRDHVSLVSLRLLRYHSILDDRCNILLPTAIIFHKSPSYLGLCKPNEWRTLERNGVQVFEVL